MKVLNALIVQLKSKNVRVSYLAEKVKFDLADDIDLENLIAKSNEIADKIEPGSKIVVK